MPAPSAVLAAAVEPTTQEGQPDELAVPEPPAATSSGHRLPAFVASFKQYSADDHQPPEFVASFQQYAVQPEGEATAVVQPQGEATAVAQPRGETTAVAQPHGKATAVAQAEASVISTEDVQWEAPEPVSSEAVLFAGREVRLADLLVPRSR